MPIVVLWWITKKLPHSIDSMFTSINKEVRKNIVTVNKIEHKYRHYIIPTNNLYCIEIFLVQDTYERFLFVL